MAETDKIEALEAKVVDEANSPNPQADAPKKNAVAAEPTHLKNDAEDLGPAVVKPTDSNPDATKKMKKVWEEEHTFDLWLKIEIATCVAWNKKGVIPDRDLEKIKKSQFNISSYMF